MAIFHMIFIAPPKASQAQSRVPNINFDIWIFWGDPINIPRKIANRRQSAFSLVAYIKCIARALEIPCSGKFGIIKIAMSFQEFQYYQF